MPDGTSQNITYLEAFCMDPATARVSMKQNRSTKAGYKFEKSQLWYNKVMPTKAKVIDIGEFKASKEKKLPETPAEVFTTLLLSKDAPAGLKNFIEDLQKGDI